MNTHRTECDVSPIPPCKVCQLCADSSDVLDVLTLPDPIRQVRSMIEELARLKEMQRRRVQFLLIHHTMRRMIQQPGELSVSVELENRRHAPATCTERRRWHSHRRVDQHATWWWHRHLSLREARCPDRRRWHRHGGSSPGLHRAGHGDVPRRWTWHHRHLHRRSGSGCLSTPGCPGCTEVRTKVRRRAGWCCSWHRYDRAWGNHWLSLLWWGCRIGAGHAHHRGVCRHDWLTVPGRHRTCGVRRPWLLLACILRLGHGHRRCDKWRRHMVRGGSHR
jgi:hypothetical protein